jgi:hypothetical protein
MKFNGLDKPLIVFLVLCNTRIFCYFGTGFNKGDLVVIEVEIKNGRARIALSPCKLKVCIKSGYIQYVDSLSACLPNIVVVRIDGKAQRGLDAIVE